MIGKVRRTLPIRGYMTSEQVRRLQGEIEANVLSARNNLETYDALLHFCLAVIECGLPGDFHSKVAGAHQFEYHNDLRTRI